MDIGCYGKVAHKTYYAAMRETKKLSRFKDGIKINAYKCKTCNQYHLGNTLDGRGKKNERRVKTTERHIKVVEE